jgi:ABC-type multidrug transport system fused ATPase/permease subunit
MTERPRRRGTDIATTVRRALELTRGQRRPLVLGLALALTATAATLAQPVLAASALEAGRSSRELVWIVLLVVALVAVEALCDGVGRFVLARTGERIVLDLRSQLVSSLLRVAMPAYDQQRIGDLLSRAGTDAMLVRDAIAAHVVQLISASVLTLGGVALMVWLDPLLGALVVATMAAGAAFVTTLLHRIEAASEDAQRNLGAMTAELERALSAMRTVRSMRAEDREQDRIAGCARALYGSNVRAARLEAVVLPALGVAARGSMVVALVVGALRVSAGAMSLPELVAFLFYASYVAMPMANVSVILAEVQRGRAALRRLDEVRVLPREQGSLGLASPPPSDVSPAAPQALLELRDVWFGYRPGHPVLRGVSFAVPHRSCVALVGPSGAGKSTIFALLERFYQPDSGAILLDGHDVVGDLSIDECRARIGLVEQHAPLLHGSVRENVGYARPEADEADLWWALELANVAETVRRLPDGLDTAVGEHGTMLSGGERQRIAIARALLLRPQLLLLDEPTSQLDAANAAALADAIARVSAHCTLLVIAHRRSTIGVADQTVLLEAGRVADILAPSPSA